MKVVRGVEVGEFFAGAFAYDALPYRVIFGSGTAGSLRVEAKRLGIKRTMVLTTPAQASLVEEARKWLGDRFVVSFAEARIHTPVSTTERADEIAAEYEVDGIVALGGGSTIGLSKALSIRMELPQIAIPTTYAGSEKAATGLHDLGRRLGIPVGLERLGMPGSGVDRAADLVLQNPYPNPRPLERDAIRDLISRAHRGDPPALAVVKGRSS